MEPNEAFLADAVITPWHGSNPFFVLIEHWVEGEKLRDVVDVDEYGWTQKHAELMRVPGSWFLVEKATNRPWLALTVEDGEQPYYMMRHTGILAGLPGAGQGQILGNKVTAHGIGKKRTDGTVLRLWVLPNGMVVGGDSDPETFGMRLLKGQL